MMTEEEIKAADWIIKNASWDVMTLPEMGGFAIDVIMNLDNTIYAAERLKNAGLLETSNRGEAVAYKLTEKAIKFKQSSESFRNYLQEEAEKEAIQKAKDERDEKAKDAQLKKLEAELAVLKDMQNEQRMFWQSGIARDKRQRWQFQWTFILAAAGFLLSIINFLKDIILP